MAAGPTGSNGSVPGIFTGFLALSRCGEVAGGEVGEFPKFVTLYELLSGIDENAIVLKKTGQTMAIYVRRDVVPA